MERARFPATDGNHQHSGHEDHEQELEGDANGVPEAALEASSADGEPGRHVEDAACDADPAKPAGNYGGSSNDRAVQSEGQAQQHPEESVYPPLGPTHGLGVGE